MFAGGLKTIVTPLRIGKRCNSQQRDSVCRRQNFRRLHWRPRSTHSTYATIIIVGMQPCTVIGLFCTCLSKREYPVTRFTNYGSYVCVLFLATSDRCFPLLGRIARTECKDAAYCYRRSVVYVSVCVSVCVCVCVSVRHTHKLC